MEEIRKEFQTEAILILYRVNFLKSVNPVFYLYLRRNN